MDEKLLGDEFFQGSTSVVARNLVGKKLIRQIGGRFLACRIVEAEAYLPENDDACHASRKKTPRNEVMFADPGCIYVYSIHARYCVNVVTEKSGIGCAVLIRSAIPLQGKQAMRRNRSVDNEFQLLSGPAKLCEAFQVDKTLNGLKLGPVSGLWIADDGFQTAPDDIRATPRIGVTSAKKKLLRFVLRNSPYASGPKYLR